MGSLRRCVLAGAFALLAGCSSSSPRALDGGADAGQDAGADGGSGQADGGDAGTLSCADFGFVASGESCGTGCGGVSCDCPDAFPRSVAACTADGCIVAQDCAAVCAAPDLGAALACTGTHSVGLDAGTDAGVASPCFPTAVRFAGPGSGQLGVADVNGDGRLDLLSATYDQLWVWRNAGDGGFDPPATNPGLQSFIYQAADLDGDGRVDLVFDGLDRVGLSFNDGDGGFTPGFVSDAGTSLGGFALADFDQDGRLDLATPVDGGGGGAYAIYWNPPADAGWGAHDTFFQGYGARGVGATDLNGDGWPELLVADEGPDLGSTNFNVLLNQKDGGFADGGHFDTFDARDWAFADFDRDGHQDVAVSRDLWRGDGAGGLERSGTFEMGIWQRPVDVDGDGAVDLVSNGTSDGDWVVEVAWNDGAGGFSRTSGLPLSTDYRSSFVFGDFDGDGRTDLARLDAAKGEISVALNTCGPGSPPACATQGSPCGADAQCCSNRCGGGACL